MTSTPSSSRVEDGIPYAIDFMNPAPDADLAFRRRKLRLDRERRRRPCRAKKATEPPGPGRPIARTPAQGIDEAVFHDRDRRGIPDHRSGPFDLRSHINAEIISKGKPAARQRIKAEMHQSVVEVGTGVCRNMKRSARRHHRPAAGPCSRSPGTTACCSAPSPRIHSRTGASRTFIPTSDTCRSSRTCRWWRAST